ncbi:DNA alkylation repair protein [bacterium]|nr:DNA alkylation repair protein [bacterium]
MKIISSVKKELKEKADAEKAQHLQKFFKAVPGGYGEGDKFIGVVVPDQRKIAKRYYKDCTLQEAEQLLNTEIHEYRLTSLFILIYKFEKLKEEEKRREIVHLYVNNMVRVNNWDLVDLSSYKILGPFLEDKDKSLLYELTDSGDLWKQRIAVITTFHFIRNGQYSDTLKIAEILLNHKHDLIHKAVGWMLREVGKRDFETEYDFLRKHYNSMPRTMLRYAIEKFDEKLRKQFLYGEIE